MTSGQKIALSLLSAFALFAAFVLSFHTFLFKKIEMKFYTQAKIEDNVEQLNDISKSYNLYIKNVLEKTETADDAYVKTYAVRSYFDLNPSEKDVGQRRLLTEKMFSDISGLDGIRIIDKNGRNVHFSSYDKTDVLRQTGVSKIYKNYPDIVQEFDEISFDILSEKLDEKKSSFMFDDVNNRLIIGIPVCWTKDIYSGSCLFYFNLCDIEKELINSDVLSIGQNIQIFSNDDLSGGFVVGVPSSLRNEIKAPIMDYIGSDTSKVFGGWIV